MMLGLSLSAAVIARPFLPSALFFANENGVWYDPSDLSTLFQDAAGTTPVTAAGQPVGKVLDKSGRGNHATQVTATSRPILGLENGRYYLTFDGTDDWLSTSAIDFTGSDKMTVVAGVRKLSDVNQAMLLELSATSSTNAGAIAVFAPDNYGVATFAFRSRGSALPALTTVSGQASPVTAVVTAIGDISGDKADIRVNRVVTQGAADQGTGTYGNYPLYIGRRGGTTLPFNGRLYGLIVRGAASSSAQIAAVEAYMNAKTGAY